ncbi:hypothetical protein H0H92_004458 [Tricholoma furcatifolium]|nr:hypothetical protein H0H92_004458 [Tricholoma furcatifolium]
METIAQLKSTAISDAIEPTLRAFIPLLEVNRAKIEEIPRKTFQYGSTDRHKLDVYYPLTPSESGKTSILVWVYGGGFVTGDRQLPPPNDMGYTAMGSFFARRGFIVVIPDYRLAPATIFPGAAEDVRNAMLWTIKNVDQLLTPTTPRPDVNNMFLMGHSAGAIHIYSSLLIPETPETAVVRPSIAGAIFHGASCNLDDPTNPFHEIAVQYYGGRAEFVEERMPTGMLKKASEATIAALPRTLIVLAEWEPEWMLEGADVFHELLEKRTGKKIDKFIARGHNHISPNFAVGSGQGEEWADEVIAWIRG